MTSIGTLFAFILVCIGVWIMRRRRPDMPRGFMVPALPLVSTLGIIVCGAMIYGLGWTNWLRLAVWLVIGLVFYFGYARTHSRLASPARTSRPLTASRGTRVTLPARPAARGRAAGWACSPAAPRATCSSKGGARGTRST